MELKWLEDFLSLARTRSFSRSASERNVTQSAFSRRVKALEQWLDVQLIDRSTYPTTLTDAGLQFLETAEETVRMLQTSRAALQAKSRPGTQVISIAALHSLSLQFFPRWFHLVEERTGFVGSRLLPDDFHNCIQALVEGTYDFLLTYHHTSVTVPLDSAHYPHIIVGHDELLPILAARCRVSDKASNPLLSYAPNSFLGRVAMFASSQPGAPQTYIAHTNENAMAEALKAMAVEGHGIAWLPKSIVSRELADGVLDIVGPAIPLEIRLYRNARRMRHVVETVWTAASTIEFTR